ncbi:MAG: hypothetical protein FWC82_01375 [Firmicutes bacterium]|nr:hypothetical protein [Bacillota bacterium]
MNFTATIQPEIFMQDPQKYFNEGAVILTAQAYKQLATDYGIQQGLRDVAMGKTHSLDEVFAEYERRIKEAEASGK